METKMKLTPEEEEIVKAAKEQQRRFDEQQRERAELKKLRSEAAIGVELAKRIEARGGVVIGLDPAELPDHSDDELKLQSALGKELARRLSPGEQK